MSAPCKDCQQRYIGCHSLCEDYQSFAKAVENARAKRFDTLARENDYTAFRQNGKQKAKRGHR